MNITARFARGAEDAKRKFFVIAVERTAMTNRSRLRRKGCANSIGE